MKKIFLISIFFLVISVSACGNKNFNDDNINNDYETENQDWKYFSDIFNGSDRCLIFVVDEEVGQVGKDSIVIEIYYINNNKIKQYYLPKVGDYSYTRGEKNVLGFFSQMSDSEIIDFLEDKNISMYETYTVNDFYINVNTDSTGNETASEELVAYLGEKTNYGIFALNISDYITIYESTFQYFYRHLSTSELDVYPSTVGILVRVQNGKDYKYSGIVLDEPNNNDVIVDGDSYKLEKELKLKELSGIYRDSGLERLSENDLYFEINQDGTFTLYDGLEPFEGIYDLSGTHIYFYFKNGNYIEGFISNDSLDFTIDETKYVFTKE